MNNFEIVKQILEENPSARDKKSLPVLYYQFYIKKYGIERAKEIAYSKTHIFFEMIASGAITSLETIGRSRRNVVLKFPDLQGKDWVKNQILEKVIRQKYAEEKTIFSPKGQGGLF